MAGAWLGASPVCLGGRASPRSRRLRALGLGGLGAGLASAPALRRRRARAAASSEDRDRRSGEAKKTMGRPAEGGVSVGDSMMAGAFAGMLSRVAVAPLDVIKICMQVQVEPVGMKPRRPRRGQVPRHRAVRAHDPEGRGRARSVGGHRPGVVPVGAVHRRAVRGAGRVQTRRAGKRRRPGKAAARVRGWRGRGRDRHRRDVPVRRHAHGAGGAGEPRVYESLPAAARGY